MEFAIDAQPELSQFLRGLPQTICQGDLQRGNLMFRDQQSDSPGYVLVDWSRCCQSLTGVFMSAHFIHVAITEEDHWLHRSYGLPLEEILADLRGTLESSYCLLQRALSLEDKVGSLLRIATLDSE